MFIRGFHLLITGWQESRVNSQTTRGSHLDLCSLARGQGNKTCPVEARGAWDDKLRWAAGFETKSSLAYKC